MNISESLGFIEEGNQWYVYHSLGWQLKVEIEDGVQKLFDWYKDSLK